jgi:hypothetical protein
MKPQHRDFHSIKNAMFDSILPPNADPARVGLIAAGTPDVIAEAMSQERYARKRGGRVKHLDAIGGGRAHHRLDRRNRSAQR